MPTAEPKQSTTEWLAAIILYLLLCAIGAITCASIGFQLSVILLHQPLTPLSILGWSTWFSTMMLSTGFGIIYAVYQLYYQGIDAIREAWNNQYKTGLEQFGLLMMTCVGLSMFGLLIASFFVTYIWASAPQVLHVILYQTTLKKLALMACETGAFIGFSLAILLQATKRSVTTNWLGCLATCIVSTLSVSIGIYFTIQHSLPKLIACLSVFGYSPLTCTLVASVLLGSLIAGILVLAFPTNQIPVPVASLRSFLGLIAALFRSALLGAALMLCTSQISWQVMQGLSAHAQFSVLGSLWQPILVGMLMGLLVKFTYKILQPAAQSMDQKKLDQIIDPTDSDILHKKSTHQTVKPQLIQPEKPERHNLSCW